jgi:hypothetical protein
MDLTTKFDKGQFVFTIDKDEIVKLPVDKIEVIFERKARIKYVLLKYKAVNFGDPDFTVIKDEEECFKTLDDLVKYYELKINLKK